MSRSLIPNVRRVSNTDVPILPFLAPRLFAEPAIYKDETRRNTRCFRRPHKEKEDETQQRIIDDGRNLCPSGEMGERNIHPYATSRGATRCERQKPLLSRFHSRVPLRHNDRRYNSTYAPVHTSENARYADIHRVVSRSSSDYNAPAALQVTSVIPDNIIDGSSAAVIWKQTGTFSRNIVKDDFIDGKRKEALQKLSKEYAKFMAHPVYSSVPPNERKFLGQYRKIHRQIDNYTRSDSGEVDPGPKAFVALDRKVFNVLRKQTYPLTIRHDPRCQEWMDELFEDVYSPEELADKWRVLSGRVGDSKNPNKVKNILLFYLLDHHPLRALQFLQATVSDQDHNYVMLANSLEHLARLFATTKSELYSTEKAGHMLVEVFCSALRTQLHKFPSIFTQDLLQNLAKLADPSQLPEVYDALVDNDVLLEYHTLCHWAEALGEIGDDERAISALKRITGNNARMNQHASRDEPFLKATTTILRKCGQQGNNYHRTPRIVSEFTKLGVKPDLFINNVVIANAVDAGDFRTALQVYKSMEPNGILPDKFTFSTLLHGFSRSDDPAVFVEFAEHCKIMAYELRDSWLATDYLHYVHARNEYAQLRPVLCARALLQTYSRFFTFAPVQALLPSWAPTNLENSIHMEPTPLSLYILLTAEIRCALEISNARVLDLYRHFKHIAAQDLHPAITVLASTTHIYNAFIKAFCLKRQFASASELISDMTTPPPTLNISIPKPGPIAWTCFMESFFSVDQVPAAERVLKIMRERGVEPDQVTWQLLLREYAKRQRVEKFGEVLEMIDVEGGLEPELLEALARVGDRARLETALERSRWVREEKKWESKQEKKRGWKSIWDRGVLERVGAVSGEGLVEDTSRGWKSRRESRTDRETYKEHECVNKDTSSNHSKYSYLSGSEYLFSSLLFSFLFLSSFLSTLADVRRAMVLQDDFYATTTRILLMENSNSRTIMPLDEFRAITRFARSHGVRVHLDGAWMWEVPVAGAVPLKKYCSEVDSVSMCFTKRLCELAGNIMAGSENFMRQARKVRKSTGGSMRRPGINIAMAAAGVAEVFNSGSEKNLLRRGHELAPELVRCWTQNGGRLS
ncbi:hypothetical protein GQ43DRAFT_465895 [Delitschia confertaspora ATCC 74209]|uniref:Aromatic amino acid beta-eliminating lyase/threonine aldolase domain-containing protein n=1 Tax=Delitschia confertaspora ATCC 74209 TaxID=1513339 RepID=A0A9P4JHI4_9PLEO|nr:hypothetical protein GQ43DRAFT_465895 [Delitschia confertaspora ATCC 74209]